jgi:hypothetical protein
MFNFFVLALVVLCMLAFTYSVPSGIGAYKVSDVTVSGISSGGYMAVQMHISHSATVNGSAIFAGGPFYCAEGTLSFAENKCMKTIEGLPNVEGLVALTHNDALFGYIDSVNNLKDDRVYLFSGSADSVVHPAVMHSLHDYYNHFIAASNVVADFNVPAEHCIPTNGQFGEPCSSLSSPYIGICNFDGAGLALQTLFGTLEPPVTPVDSNLIRFLQTPYIDGIETSLADYGYIYIPTACANGASCHLHISFHGCLQTEEDIGNAYASKSGYNQWAEANNIIVLYPYAKKSKDLPINPNGCWDWWGYTNQVYYGTRLGPQVKFARKLIEAISGK